MKKFLRNTALMILVFLLLNAMGSWFFKKKVLSESILFRKDKQFETFDDTLTWLLMGDSRIQNDIVPDLIGNCFNYSSANENLFQSYFKLKRLLQNGHRPEFLIYQLDYSTLSKKHSDRFKNDSYWVRYVDYLEMARIKRDRHFWIKYLQGRFFPYAGEYKLLNEYLFSKKSRTKSELWHGFRPRYGNFSNITDRGEAGFEKAKFYLGNRVYMEEKLTYYFEKFLELCDSKGIKVIFVMMPMTREFLDGVDKVIPGNNYYQYLNILLNKYECIEAVLDYQESFANRPELFWNPDHMNRRGAEAFTLMLRKDLYQIESGQ